MAAYVCLLDAARFSVSLVLWANETFAKPLPLAEAIKHNVQQFSQQKPSLGHSLPRASTSFLSQCFCAGPQIHP